MTLYGIAEIAVALEVPRGTVAQWHRRGKLPPPSAKLAMGPVWYGRAIDQWLGERALLAGPDGAA